MHVIFGEREGEKGGKRNKAIETETERKRENIENVA